LLAGTATLPAMEMKSGVLATTARESSACRGLESLRHRSAWHFGFGPGPLERHWTNRRRRRERATSRGRSDGTLRVHVRRRRRPHAARARAAGISAAADAIAARHCVDLLADRRGDTRVTIVLPGARKPEDGGKQGG